MITITMVDVLNRDAYIDGTRKYPRQKYWNPETRGSEKRLFSNSHN